MNQLILPPSLDQEAPLTLEDIILRDCELQIMSILGFERGYNQNADALHETVDGRNINGLWREFQASLRIFNSERDALLNGLTFDVTEPVESVMQPSQFEDFEQATEFGEPKGVRLGRPFNIGYSFTWWDIAARFTWMFLAEAMSSQVESIHASVLEAGNRLYFSRVMRQLFNGSNTTATIEGAAYNVYALYNSDGTVPPPFRGTTFTGTHNHYITSGAATIDPGDVNAMEDHLYHHGYRFGEGYELILMVNRQEGTIIRTFQVGVNSSRWTFIPDPTQFGGGTLTPAGVTVVGAPQGRVRNQIGTYGPFKVVEDDYIPAGYVLAYASGGPQNIGNLVGIRQHANTGLRGLQLVKGRDNDYPLVDSFYRFGFGTGIRQRGAGVVQQITASGTYTPPALYA
jgi:hypothetical protein